LEEAAAVEDETVGVAALTSNCGVVCGSGDVLISLETGRLIAVAWAEWSPSRIAMMKMVMMCHNLFELPCSIVKDIF
jgi:hypothetical protein